MEDVRSVEMPKGVVKDNISTSIIPSLVEKNGFYLYRMQWYCIPKNWPYTTGHTQLASSYGSTINRQAQIGV